MEFEARARQELVAATVAWAAGRRYPPLSELKRELALKSHRHYFNTIPHYRRHCERWGFAEEVKYEDIVSTLMISDDYFKSYSASLIEKRDFAKMNEWIGSISTLKVSSQPENIDQWFAELEAQGTSLVFSSGTSGHMSFVPRDRETWADFLQLPLIYMPLLMARKNILPFGKKWLLLALSRWLSPEKLLNLTRIFALKEFDGYFLSFSGGNQGIQLAGHELSKLTGKAEFLYPIRMTPQAVGAIVRGASDVEARRAADEFLAHTVWRKDSNYDRILASMEDSIRRRRKIIIFGTPYLVMELCQRLAQAGKSLQLRKGSQVVYGGGWKSFQGERISESELQQLIAARLGVPSTFVNEGYSMTEIQGVMMKCASGRYHVPPFFETVLYDEALRPKAADATSGILGVIDPFARSYPGFIITGDEVTMGENQCPCGLSGRAIETVARASGREVKGCGGIMAAVNA